MAQASVAGSPASANGTGRRLRRRPTRPVMAVAIAVALALSCATLLVVAGRAAKASMALVVLSVFVAYLLAPAEHLVRRIAHRRRVQLPTWSALALIYAAVALGLGLARLVFGERMWTQVGRFTAGVPTQVDLAVELTSSFDRWQGWFGWPGVSTSRAEGVALALSDWVRLHVAEVLVDALDYGWIGPWFAVVPILSFVLLSQFASFRRSTLRVIPAGHLRWRGHEFLEQVNRVLAGYVRAQVISAAIVTVTCCVGFAILRVPYALLVGIAAGALELIPLLGPISAALLVAGLVRGGRLAIVLLFLVAVRLFQDAVVYPRLMGRRVHLPPLAVLVAVWLGATLGGILGVLLAVPVVAVSAVAWRHVRDYRAIQQLVRGQKAVATPPEVGATSHSS